MRHGVQQTEFVGSNFLPFSTTNNSKNQDFEKWKKCLEISSFYTSVPKIMILCHTVPEIWHVTDVICIFHFKLFFALLPPAPLPPPPQQSKKTKFHKMKKTTGDIIILDMWTKNYDHMMYSSWDMVSKRWMDRWTDRWTNRKRSCKSDIQRWVPHLKNFLEVFF